MIDKRKQIIGIIFWIGVTFLAAAVGSAASVNSQSFYAQITQPSWAPPGYVFGPVWTVLYTLMGISAWLIWRIGGFKHAQTGLILFGSSTLTVELAKFCCVRDECLLD
jgi:translocator protein